MQLTSEITGIELRFTNAFLALGVARHLETPGSAIAAKILRFLRGRYTHILLTDDSMFIAASPPEQKRVIILFGHSRLQPGTLSARCQVISWRWLLARNTHLMEFQIPKPERRTLTKLEAAVMREIALGIKYTDIAQRFACSAQRISAVKKNGMEKLGMRNKFDLLHWAHKTWPLQ